MGKIYFIFSIILILFCGEIRAQVSEYTQYNQSILFTNPSGIGTRSEARITAQYRGQELSAGVSRSGTVLTGVYPLFNKEKSIRRGGLGFSFLRESTGEKENIVLQGLAAAYAYNLAFNHNSFLSFGMQGGYFQQKISMNGATTGNQWTDLHGFNPDLPTGELFDKDRKGYLTFGTGFTFYKEDEFERQIASFGVSAFHLNRPDISFSEEAFSLDPTYSLQACLALLRNETWHIGPEAIYTNAYGQHLFQSAVVARHYFNNQNPFDMIKDGYIGFKGGYRNAHYAILGLELQQPGFQVGFSYDAGVTAKAVPGNAFEVTFTLRKLFKKKNPAVVENNEYTLGEVRDFYNKEAEPSAASEQDQQQNSTRGDYNIELRKDFKFGFNETTLNDEAMEYLDELASLLLAHPGTNLEVIGHTDDVGSNLANKKVSLLRAEAVVDYLISKGIEKRRLKATGQGNSMPLLPNDSEENRAKNRRVEFVIYE